MITLAINTASGTEALAIFNEKKLLGEMNWKGNYDESKKLLPAMERLLKKTRLSLGKIDRIVVISGPGPFSALRIGVTVAATLAYTLDVPLYEIDTPSLWAARLPDEISARRAILLIHAGGIFVSRSGGSAKGILKIDEALHGLPVDSVFYGDITQKEMKEFTTAKKRGWKFLAERELKSFGETLVTLKKSNFKKSAIVRPKYWKPPNIGAIKA